MEGSILGGLAVVFLAAMLTNNILLSRFLGMCSFIAISRNMRNAWSMGLAVVFVTFFTALINYGVYFGILVKDAPLLQADLTHLTFIVFIAIIAAFVQLVEMVIERCSPALYHALGIYLPLITVNCAILGVNLFMIEPDMNLGLLKSAVYALGSGLGFLLAICLMAGLRSKLESADVPVPLRGLGITIIITGLMAMSFMGFTGMVQQ
jgi:Na+-transporting NADH:ubiquinone oxidoreductase subunit E